ncbi:apolipoprotein N-acyltransferase [Tropicibacter sp. Alg240-R139]|uniref:apolipoprotein N-acyltransferase n=1 Tax=Tropicibacter sp. Alg240-R139 TaxID=2305991 RepID=UPI0013E07D33|nr:apolipoprotein N-acyltransferase [Tropicibacter sp. Alg240-R139]
MNRLLAGPLWSRLALTALLGAIAAFGLAPFGAWWATLAVLILVPSVLASADSRPQAFGLGWALGLGYFAHALVWIVEPFFVDPERHAWMAPFALIFLSGGLALFWGAAFWFAQWFGRTLGARTWVLICALSLAEFARAYVFTGFPWAALAQVWVDTDVALLLAWIGPHGLAMITVMAALTAGLLLINPGRALWNVAPVVFFAAAIFAVGRTAPDVAGTGQTVRLIQPNAPQHQKWDPAYMPTFYERQIEYTAALPRPDLIVWPETAVPVWLETGGPALDRIAAAADGAALALGIRRSEGSRIFNSMVYVDVQGQVAGVYDKHHLVPFGEYVPFGDLMARFGIYGFAANNGQGFSAGSGPELVSMGPLGHALPLICYEAVFPQDINGVSTRPEFLLQVTNDAWFGARSGPYQHLAQARMRAIEQGVPLMRAANTGVSAMIDPLGRVTASLALGQAGYVDAELPAPLPPTLYARTGDLLAFVALILLSFAVAASQRPGTRRK